MRAQLAPFARLARSSAPLVAAALLLTRCSQPLTELVIGLSTDLADPQVSTDPLALSDVHLTILNLDTGMPVGDTRWTLSPGGTHLPDAYVVYTSDNRAPPLLRIEAVGTLRDGTTIVRTSVVRLTPRRNKFIRLMLARSCRNLDATYCGGSTCIEGRCVTPFFDANRLPDYHPGDEKKFSCLSTGVGGPTLPVDTSVGTSLISTPTPRCPSTDTCIEDTCYAAISSAATTCTDGQRNGFETDVDCGGGDGGGDCPKRCAHGQQCSVGSDCVSLVCDDAKRCACPLHFADCGGGGCVDLDNDLNFCGACGIRCPPGDRCVAGKCQLSCQDTPQALTACGSHCVDLQRDADNCGGCGRACPMGYACVNGVCAASCPMGSNPCPIGGAASDGGVWSDGGIAPDGGVDDGGVASFTRAVCVDFQRDGANCGGCGIPCAAGFVCKQGTCARSCPAGLDDCAGKCVNAQIDPLHCGACGTACDQGNQCRGGVCRSLCSASLGLPGPPALASGQKPFGLFAGDLNGDGLPDLVVANSADNNLGVYLNRGDGSFDLQVSRVASATPVAITGGDWNGDGKQDLAVAVASGVDLLLGNGDGTFAPRTSIAPTAGAYGAAAADLNGDGKLDLVIANTAGNSVVVLHGRGNGTFTAGGTIANFAGPRRLALGDLDGDGKLDLAVTNFGGNQLSVLLGVAGGQFGPATSYATGLNPWDAALADVNGDGKLDIAVASEGSNTVSVYVNKGAGAFAAQVAYPVGGAPRSLIAADINGDTFVDLITSNRGAGTLSVLLGSKGGALAPAASYRIGSQVASLAAADFNGDGALDVVASNFAAATLGVALGRPDGSFTAPPALVAAGAVKVTVAADLNNDGIPDLVAAGGSTLSVWMGRGPGPGPGVSVFAAAVPYRPFAAATDTVLVGDWDSDGNLDLLTPGSALQGSFFHGRGDGTFAAPTLVNVGRGFAASADFDGDGKLDVATADNVGPAIWVALGGGNGSFKLLGPSLKGGGASSGIAVGDLDNDGKPDIVVSDPQRPASVVFGAAGGNPRSPIPIPSTGPANALALADLDGDGKLDLVLAPTVNPAVAVLLGNGDRTFTPLGKLPFVGSPVASIAVADLDGDGKLDLALTTQSNAVTVLFGSGGGNFQAPQTWSSGGGSAQAAVADLNGDGRPDLAVSNRGDGTVSVHLNRGPVCGR